MNERLQQLLEAELAKPDAHEDEMVSRVNAYWTYIQELEGEKRCCANFAANVTNIVTAITFQKLESAQSAKRKRTKQSKHQSKVIRHQLEDT